MTPSNWDLLRVANAAGATYLQLVDRDYDLVERMTSGRRFSASELELTINALGSPLVDIPGFDWPGLTRLERPEKPGAFELTVPLRTVEGWSGRGMTVRVAVIDEKELSVEIVSFGALDPPALDPIAHPPRERRPSFDPIGPPNGVNPVPVRWHEVLEPLVLRLVDGDYAGLAADGLVSFTDDPDDGSIGEWIEDYPGTLVHLPPEAWSWSDHGPNAGEPGLPRELVTSDLWCREVPLEGCSPCPSPIPVSSART